MCWCGMWKGRQGFMWPVGRRRASASPVTCTDRECPQRPGRTPPRGPCSCPCRRKKVPLRSSGPGFAPSTAPHCRTGQGPRCLSRPACVGRAHWRLDEEDPSLFVGESRFGQQDKRWSLHTAITIPFVLFRLRQRCCNAAMLHSLNFGRRLRTGVHQGAVSWKSVAWRGRGMGIPVFSSG